MGVEQCLGLEHIVAAAEGIQSCVSVLGAVEAVLRVLQVETITSGLNSACLP